MAKEKSRVGMMQRTGPEGLDANEFIKEYERSYVEKGARSGYKKKRSFSPSTLGYGHGTCPRYWYIAFTGANFEDSPDSKSLGNMDNGTYSHERIQQNFENMGILKHKELEITNTDPPIRGFVDAIVDWKDADVPVEVKTANSNSFIFRQTTGKPSGSHFVQFLIYLKLTKSPGGFLFYENKDTQEICVIPITVSEQNKKHVEYLFDWRRQTYKAFEDETLPEKPWTRKNAKICQGCPVRKDCFEKFDEGVVNLPVLGVPKP
jgi:CRISPR/Cas system-associated exonuclease Cas4 (RecB family)